MRGHILTAVGFTALLASPFALAAQQLQLPDWLPPVKEILLVLGAAISTAMGTALLFQKYINARVVAALKTPEAEQQIDVLLHGPRLAQRIVAVFDTPEGRKRFGEILAMPEVWTSLAKATISLEMPVTYLERSDVKKTLAEALKNDPCRDAIGDALRNEVAIKNIAAALYDKVVQEAVLAVMAGPARQTISAIVASVDIGDRVIAALRANPAALIEIINSDRGLLILVERNDVRERVLRWLNETEEGRRYFDRLFQQQSTREALADALLFHVPTLQRLHDMLENPAVSGPKHDPRQP